MTGSRMRIFKNATLKFLYNFMKLYLFMKKESRGAQCLLVHNGKVLLVRATYNDYFSFPGGGIKRGETAEEAAKRELAEETGIDATKLHLVGEYVHDKGYVKDHISLFCVDGFQYGDRPKSRRWEIDESDFYSLLG